MLALTAAAAPDPGAHEQSPLQHVIQEQHRRAGGETNGQALAQPFPDVLCATDLGRLSCELPSPDGVPTLIGRLY